MSQIITLITILLYVAVVLGISFSSFKTTKTMDSFLLGGRNVGPWISAFSYGTTYFSAVIFIGFAGMLGWRIGIGSLWIGIGNAVIGSMP